MTSASQSTETVNRRHRGCLPGPGGDFIFTRAYLREEVGLSNTTIRKWICDPNDPLPHFGADTKSILIYASDLFPYIRRRGPNAKAARTAAHHARTRARKRAATPPHQES